METQSAMPQPMLQYGRRNRKYGRYDFERFEHLSSSHASIGHGTFHKVNVNCRFLFKKSRWGVLGEHKNPAGIIYLDLSFDQPKDCQLHSATVIVTLDDEDKELHTLRSRRGALSQYPVQLLDFYGPRGFVGPEKNVRTNKSLHFNPNAQFAGVGVGGIGVDKESSLTQSSRWKFSGLLLRGKGRSSPLYKSLKWDLSENDLESQSMHSNEVHTAFTFEHGGQPFFMRVEIKGKLKKLHSRVADRLMRFPSNAKSDDGSAVTLIDFGGQVLGTPLDERARALEFEMEMANLHAIPMQVSDPKPVTFQNAAPNSGPATSPLQQTLPASTQHTTEDETDPMLADLAQAFDNLRAMDRKIPHHNDSTKSSSATMFARGETESAKADGEASSDRKNQAEFSEEQMLLKLLRMPLFVTFLRVITGLLGFFNPRSPGKTLVDGADKRQHIHTINEAADGTTGVLPGNSLFPVEQRNGVLHTIKSNDPRRALNNWREEQR